MNGLILIGLGVVGLLWWRSQQPQPFDETPRQSAQIDWWIDTTTGQVINQPRTISDPRSLRILQERQDLRPATPTEIEQARPTFGDGPWVPPADFF